MKKTERLFRIIDRLRGRKTAMTADQLALEMDVSVRTIYRDMKSLAGQAIPVEGEAGVGYLLGSGFDAPPLAFDRDELEALAIGLRLIGREGDPILKGAALSALEKIRNTSKSGDILDNTPIYAPSFGHADHLHMMSIMRIAIRKASIMTLDYEDAEGAQTLRTVKPVAMLFFPQSHLLAAWCCLRNDFRNFRLDRIRAAHDEGENFTAEKPALMRQYKIHIRTENTCAKTDIFQ